MAVALLFVGAALLTAGVALRFTVPDGLIVAGVLFLVAGVDASRDLVKPKNPGRE